jgi:hypothetical protein
MPSPQDVVTQAMLQVHAEPELRGLSPSALQRLEQILGQAIAAENEACMVALWNATEGKERDAMVSRFGQIVHLAHRDLQGNPLQSNLQTAFWTCWYPGLETDELTVGSLLDTLPGLAADEVPAIIRAFENPDSPLKLPGACTLEQHDVLHILLGRGLVDQDEAFVLGFTAQTAPDFSEADVQRYRLAFSLYPEPYCIRGCDLLAFELGIEAARRMRLKKPLIIDLAQVRPRRVAEVRAEFGIDKGILYDIFAEERQKIAGTPWSHRLPLRSSKT